MTRPVDAPTVSRLSPPPLLRAVDRFAGLAASLSLPAVDIRPQSILDAVARQTGGSWGDEHFIEPMTRVLEEVARPPFAPFARLYGRAVATRAVRNRVDIERHLARHPRILDIPIRRPVFVVGFPRTGTTLLQNLLAQEPGARALPFWELTNPTPLHADPARDASLRRRRAAADLRMATVAAPEMPIVHDVSVDTAEECWALMANTFSVLNYDLAHGAHAFGDWLLDQDLTWAYREYRRMLQIALHRASANTLVLKCPEHLWFLDALLRVFPDACVVWTHRDPVRSVASYCSMVTLSRRLDFGTVDPPALGAHIERRFAQGIDRALAVRATADPARFLDVRFEDLTADPAGTVRAIREHFDLPLTDAGLQNVQSWLDRPRQDTPGRHIYRAERYGLHTERTPAAFSDYTERFDIPTTRPHTSRRVLLVHPEFPVTYWGFQYALPMSGRRANLPPLGLATLAALLPSSWDLKIVDMNIEELTDRDLEWADLVFVGGMRVQAPSMNAVITRARALGRRTVVGGPAPTSDPALFLGADVLFQGEAEGRIDALLDAIDSEGTGIVVPQTTHYPNPKTFPVPRFDLLDVGAYGAMSVQYSRGCPYKCEFCDIVQMFGRKPRLKSGQQLLDELQAIRDTGYRGTVFVVDDNFIGNRKAVRQMLPELIAWQKERRYPFDLMTEASVNLADDDVLLRGMVEAGFTSVFLGLETPSLDALAEAGKTQNMKTPLTESIRIITAAGLEVMGGFIVGFDSDGPEVFEAQRRFIADSPVPMAMIGPLMALPATDLWTRLEKEGRLRTTGSGNDGDQFGRPNFEPSMDEEVLLRGYGELVADLYTADAYYDRCEQVLALAPPSPGLRAADPRDLLHLARTVWMIGVKSPRRRRFWRLLRVALRTRPEAFSWAVVRAMIGEHLIRYTEEHVTPRIAEAVTEVRRERAHVRAAG